MATIRLQEPVYQGSPGPIFFAAGFRPFFLSAGLLAALMLPLWLAVFVGGVDLGLPYPAAVWHGHEMVFGFAAAAVGGFLLTAVPNWTNTHHVSGRPLMVLYAAWAAGRVAMLLGGVLPPLVVAAIDLLYLPLLAALMAGPLIRAGKWRNIAFVPILVAFSLTNLAVHLDIAFGLGDGLGAIYIGITLLLVMIAIVGGRIVPSFTQNWLRMQGQAVELAPIGWIEKGGAAVSIALGGLLAAFAPGSVAAGVVLLAAAGIHLARLGRWHGLKVLRSPILWVLHLGYLWMVVGLALLGLSSFSDLPASAALHALTAGAISTMVLGVMSRAALGHSGRSLELSPLTVAAYVLLSVGAALRVAGFDHIGMTHAGGALWSLAWVLFVVVYWPIVTRPRADGRPG